MASPPHHRRDGRTTASSSIGSTVPIGTLTRALHRRRTRWYITVAIAVVLTSITVSTIGGARRARARWGDTTMTVVARRDLAAGTTIGDDDVEITPRPVAVVPADAAPVDLSVGRTVRAPIAAGEVVLDRRLAATGAHGADALAAPGSLSFAIPTDRSTPTLSIGDRVDVFAPTSTAAKAPTAARIAHSATVIAVGDRTVTIAVDPLQAPAVARALLDTAVVLAVTR